VGFGGNCSCAQLRRSDASSRTVGSPVASLYRSRLQPRRCLVRCESQAVHAQQKRSASPVPELSIRVVAVHSARTLAPATSVLRGASDARQAPSNVTS
jgi:hypothetical protein